MGEGNACRGEDRGEREVVNASQTSGYMAGVRTAMGEWTLLAVVVGIGQGAGKLCEAVPVVPYAQSGK